jgi:peroxiredoxin/outer membrane lipoprotein-sorting protein
MRVRDKGHTWVIAAATCLLLEAWALHVVGSSPARWRPALAVRDEPAAHALYDAMIQAMREARSLSYSSGCSSPDGRTCTHRVWLKKPGGLHVAMTNDPSTRRTTLVGDGTHLWTHWSGDRPVLPVDTEEDYERAKSNVYLRTAFQADETSVRGEIACLGLAWFEPILDPSLFHGRIDPLESCMDGVRSRGSYRMRGEDFDVIEVSYVKARRTRYFWLSQKDHLPRKIKEVVRGAKNEVTVEEWSEVTINEEIPPKMFTWSPPEGWRQWTPPAPEISLLRQGQEAPDFTLQSARGGKIRLSDYRGKVVWLYFWDTGSLQCREEIPALQKMHQEYKDKGLAILGFNGMDNRRIARAFLRENKATFPTVLDSSDVTANLVRTGYGNRAALVPLSYIIGPQGTVVGAWFGQEQEPEQILAALKKAGLGLAQ